MFTVHSFIIDFSRAAVLHTDDSGLEIHKRVLEPTLPISGNYHAMVSVFL
jgi:hypothetical protein